MDRTFHRRPAAKDGTILFRACVQKEPQMRNSVLPALLLIAALSAGCTTKAMYSGVQATADLKY